MNLTRPLTVGWSIGMGLALLTPPYHHGWQLVHDVSLAVTILAAQAIGLCLLDLVTSRSRGPKTR